MRGAVVAAGVAVLVACGNHAPPPPLHVVAAPLDAGAAPVPPSLRLPHDVVPTAYALTLELDPEQDAFVGKVTIHAHVATATDRVYLHAVDLDITSARAGDAALEVIPGDASVGLRGFRLPHVAAAGTDLTLELAYTGHANGDQQGLFRQTTGGHWYLFAQGESVFARRIVPCFDEPGFKAAWTVTLVVPGGDVAIANAPETGSRELPDGRREVTFATTPPIASYLLSVAVGPFDVVDAGRVGRAGLPLRIVVPAGEGEHVGSAIAAWTGKIVAGLEAYFDAPIPVAKLDFVAVPTFFGAMENPGLVTFLDSLIVDTAASGDADGHHFARVCAHELAHQWLGNAVTPPWWDDLWVSEASATWLGDKIAGELGAFDDQPLRTALARVRALAADADPDAKPLHRAVERGDDPEAGFDAIAYDKGGAVLAMIERAAGSGDAMRTAMRGYVRAHAGGAGTTADLVAAIGALAPDAGRALASYVDHVGTPIVDMELACDGAARVKASVRRGSVKVPVCVRYAAATADGRSEICTLVDGKAELPLRDAVGCPPWVTGNADGVGYYEVAWNSVGVGPMAPVPKQTPAERLVYGSDVAAALVRGDIAVTAGLAELRRLTAGSDAYGDLAATAIARAIEPFVDEGTAARWAEYLAARFAHRLTAAAMLAPATPALTELRDTLLELVPGDHLPAATVRQARAELDRELARLAAAAKPGGGRPRRAAAVSLDVDRFVLLAAMAAPSGGARLFDAMVTLARTAGDAGDGEVRFALATALGHFGVDFVERAVGLVLDGTLPAPVGWLAVRGYLERDSTRAAAWVAVAPHVGALMAVLPAADAAELVESAAGLCDATERDAVASTLGPHVSDIPDGTKALAHVLARIDRCAARRARGGGVAAALTP